MFFRTKKISLQINKFKAQKDAKKIVAAGFKNKVKKLLEILEINPFKNPPEYEKLMRDLAGAYSRRINIQRRLIYQVYMKENC